MNDFYNSINFLELVQIAMSKKKKKKQLEWKNNLLPKSDFKQLEERKKQLNKIVKEQSKLPFKELIAKYSNKNNMDPTFRKIMKQKLEQESIPDEYRQSDISRTNIQGNQKEEKIEQLKWLLILSARRNPFVIVKG
ncbi:hypothetical protein PPERSA_06993 [Pseudocohnilembus persalinus]|uniref:Uncharacterized protein n=1 Tax=Pseudocohnilembus persalinus TaxID=266149 RepID=A0A0V0QYP0_PSEPJ|nr:hypothetical protein PPERSA_06993 [Pseudocohnilembus persalinus]|eukprot:KRX07378.1 hypothetical protein PPERSA_06993 [Pseudocohnilembus persalinus]